MAGRIWSRRNVVIHGAAFKHPREIVRESCMALEDFRNAQNHQPSITVSQSV